MNGSMQDYKPFGECRDYAQMSRESAYYPNNDRYDEPELAYEVRDEEREGESEC